MPWVPRPDINAPTNFFFDNDMWIQCNGIVTCKSGRFEGQFCSDLSDRVLVGAGRLGQILDLKDASFPDHTHAHTHDSTYDVKVPYRKGPKDVWSRHSRIFGNDEDTSAFHRHRQPIEQNFTIEFSQMNPSEPYISKIQGSKISKSTAENDLYPAHMRVIFLFKCY